MVASMLLSDKILHNFPIFTHTQITHFNINAFSGDRVYLLFSTKWQLFSSRNSEFFLFQQLSQPLRK